MARVHALARRQLGLLTYEQALGLGFDKSSLHRLVSSGRWERCLPRVFRLWKSEDAWRQRVVAAAFWAGDGGAISHRCAASWWGFDLCGTGHVEVTLSSPRKAPNGVTLHRLPLPQRDKGRSGCIWVTTPTRTLLDLASVLDEAQLEAAVHSAFRNNQSSGRETARRDRQEPPTAWSKKVTSPS